MIKNCKFFVAMSENKDVFDVDVFIFYFEFRQEYIASVCDILELPE